MQRGVWLASWTSGAPLVRLLEYGATCRIDKGGTANVQIGPTSGYNSRVTCAVDGLSAPYDATLYLGDANIRKVTLDAPFHMSSGPPLRRSVANYHLNAVD